MEKIKQTISYIIAFLLQRNQEFASVIHYMTREEAVLDCREHRRQVYILKSGFFDDLDYGKEKSMPVLPLRLYEGVRIFYGSVEEEAIEGDSLLLHADIIASAYFLLTRYEEYVRSQMRDQYGRYPVRESMAYLSAEGKLTEPLVDEYGKLLCKKLAQMGYPVKPSENSFSKIFFTHDIDVPFYQYKNFEYMLRAEAHYLVYDYRIVFHPLMNWLGYYGINPRATWNYMLEAEQNGAKESAVPWESICFIISTERKDACTTPYINDKKMLPILQEMLDHGAVFGLHTSYMGAEDEKQMRAEKSKLENVLGHKVTYHRNHYLRQMQPSDMKRYEDAGFTDDFTTGYAGVAGFKLGTCHPVRFIDPADGSLHDIILHPLLIMDGSLSGAAPYQMGLNFEQAKSVCKEILDQVWRHNGEVNVLFHNGMFEDIPGNYHKQLYDWMLGYIVELANEKGGGNE